MKKLPKEFKEKWIAALRSGQYKQGQDVLYRDDTDSYCCLGVAGCIAGVSKDEMKDHTLFGDYQPEYEIAPPEGFPDILFHHKFDDIANQLAIMNDSGSTFNEIADYIEENL